MLKKMLDRIMHRLKMHVVRSQLGDTNAVPDVDRKCRHKIHGSYTECETCGQGWDTNDPCPPKCGRRSNG